MNNETRAPVPTSTEVKVHELGVIAVALMHAGHGPTFNVIAAKLRRDYGLDLSRYEVLAALSVLADALQFALPTPTSALAILGLHEVAA